MLYIEPEVCIDCGACEPACPVNAIFEESDVPEDQTHFSEINALWFSDRSAARAMVGGDGSAPAAVKSDDDLGTTEAETSDVEVSEPETSEETTAESEQAPAMEEQVEAIAAVAGTQVEALEEHVLHDGPVLPQYRLPSPTSVIAIVGLMLAFVVVWLAPGDSINNGTPIVGNIVKEWPGHWSIWGSLEGPSEIGMLALLPVVILLGFFVTAQGRELRLFDSKRDRQTAAWRESGVVWRRSEESRRYELEATIGQLARDRFPFPDEQHPEYRTYVNVPEPQLALEFTAGGVSRSQVFPDIVVVEHPRNRPIMVAQVETRETVTRRQAELVWAQLETDDAPLYLYVPSGMAARARDYAMAAGIAHVKVRTWRRQPGGMLIQEL